MTTAAKKQPRKRIDANRDNSATLQRLLDAAEALMREQGYAAVTTRRLGEHAGVTPPLVHYYFASMDDLFVSLYRQHAEDGLKRVREALDTVDVMQALWILNSDPIDAVLHVEFMALGNHRKAVREEMAKHGEQFRKLQLKALQAYLKTNGIQTQLDPQLIIVLMASTGLLLALESEVGMNFGHAKTRKFIADLIGSVTDNRP